jgi:hypothetical protein
MNKRKITDFKNYYLTRVKFSVINKELRRNIHFYKEKLMTISQSFSNAPVVTNLTRTQHENFHGFVVIDGTLYNSNEFAKKLVSLENGTIIQFVAIHGTKSIYKHVTWAEKMSGKEIYQHLASNTDLVAFTCDLEFQTKLDFKQRALSWIVSMLGDNSIFCTSESGDEIEIDFSKGHADFLLDIVKDV